MIRMFRHYMPLSLLVLAGIEAVLLMAAVVAGRYVRFSDAGWVPSSWVEMIPRALVFMAVMVGIMATLGMYERNFWGRKGDMVLRIAVSFLIGLFVMTLVYYLFPKLYLGRGEFGLSFSLAFAAVLLARFVFTHIIDRRELARRILVLGAGTMAARLEHWTSSPETRGFDVVGYVRLNQEKLSVPEDRLIPVKSNLLELTDRLNIDEIVVALTDRRRAIPTEQVLDCKFSGLQVTDLLQFFERQTGKITLAALHPSSMIYSDGFHQAALKTSSKRLFDIVASSALLIFALPVFLLTTMAILIESHFKGPIFYHQIRVGKDGREFPVLKFRSMQTDAEKDGNAQWASANDSRVTRIGAFIRKTRIDELPQLINVLRGQMSFVGPRPERPQFVQELSKNIPYYAMRHRVNPGITGWAQICYPYGASEEDAREKLQYDLYYIKNYSLFLDLTILMQTASVVLWSKGAR